MRKILHGGSGRARRGGLETHGASQCRMSLQVGGARRSGVALAGCRKEAAQVHFRSAGTSVSGSTTRARVAASTSDSNAYSERGQADRRRVPVRFPRPLGRRFRTTGVTGCGGHEEVVGSRHEAGDEPPRPPRLLRGDGRTTSGATLSMSAAASGALPSSVGRACTSRTADPRKYSTKEGEGSRRAAYRRQQATRRDSLGFLRPRSRGIGRRRAHAPLGTTPTNSW